MSEHLTETPLCEKSGLSLADLERLKTAHLLVPNTAGLYRPQLVRWAVKLDTLLKRGWEIDEIKRWAQGLWFTPNPKQWSPDRDDWRNVPSEQQSFLKDANHSLNIPNLYR
ncbi:MAG: hypothetical protein GY796_05030 [Chloroflexi bacterium]|nr:hypothetical protein [Chloroflexota bacterium]